MKDIKDYLPYYIGSPVFLCNNLEGNPVIEPLTAKMLHEDEEMFTDPEIKPYQLLLRRLEDMTKQEMIGLLQSMVPIDMEDKPTADDYDLEMFYNDDGLMVDSDIVIGANYTCICFDGQIGIRECGSVIIWDEKDMQRPANIPQAFHYLLKQGFDLFNLIDNNLAVDAKTLPK